MSFWIMETTSLLTHLDLKSSSSKEVRMITGYFIWQICLETCRNAILKTEACILQKKRELQKTNILKNLIYPSKTVCFYFFLVDGNYCERIFCDFVEKNQTWSNWTESCRDVKPLKCLFSLRLSAVAPMFLCARVKIISKTTNASFA